MKISCGTESGKGYITELIKPKTALEEDYTEYSYEQDERSASHLIDRDGSVEKADIHQLLAGVSALLQTKGRETGCCSSEVTNGRNP